MARLPRLPRTQKETHKIELKAVFASLDGKDSDADAELFMSQLEELIKQFKPKSEFKHSFGTQKTSYKKSST